MKKTAARTMMRKKKVRAGATAAQQLPVDSPEAFALLEKIAQRLHDMGLPEDAGQDAPQQPPRKRSRPRG